MTVNTEYPHVVLDERRTPIVEGTTMQDVLDVPRYLAVQGFCYHGSVSDDPARPARMERRRDVAIWNRPGIWAADGWKSMCL